MGNCQSGCSAASLPGRGAPIREATVLLLGLDDAGKSTLLANLNKESTVGISPTSGFSSTGLELAGCVLTVFDLGGGPRLRAIWKNYYAEAHGVVFVVDASAPERLPEARAVLHSALQDNRLAGKPLVIFANKQDREGALGEEELRGRLDLGALPPPLGEKEDSTQPLHVVECVAVRGEGGEGPPSADIRRGLRWLLQSMGGGQGGVLLTRRVAADLAAQRAVEARERRERAERVRRIREERERQQLQNGDSSLKEGEGEEEDGALQNPFKPIQHAIEESARRDAVVKAARRKAPPPPPSSSSQQAMVSTGGNTSNTHTTDERLAERGSVAAAVPALEVGRHGSQSSLGSSTVLSASSGGSLTDVTPHSGGGSEESLQLSGHTSSSQSGPAPSSQPGPAGGGGGGSLEPLRTSVDESRKSTRKSLLARLKSRNKTAPAPPPPPPSHSQPNSSSANEQGRPPAAVSWAQGQNPSSANEQGHPQKDTWVQGQLQKEEKHDPLKNLPELPSLRPLLPPIKLSSHPVGVQDQPYITVQDVAGVPLRALPHPPPPAPSLATS